MDVKIKDRETEVSYLRLALVTAGLSVNYVATDLIYEVQKKLSELGGKMTIADSAKLEADHEAKWDAYFARKEAGDAL